MIIQLLFGLLLFPVAALFAALVCWRFNREPESASAAFQDFMVPFVVAVVLLYGFSNTTWVRLRIDPVFRLQTEINAHPLYQAIRASHLDDNEAFYKALMTDGLRGSSLDHLFKLARPLLNKMGNEKALWADPASRIAWGKITVATLRELQDQGGSACIDVLANRAASVQALGKLSEANTREFQQILTRVLTTSTQDQRPKTAPAISWENGSQQARSILESIKLRHGEMAANIVFQRQFSTIPPEQESAVCAARIQQLEETTNTPPAMAAYLLSSFIR
jgi:hypothetical protein